ncbi:MAG TPA: hypothetical protein VGB77_06410 [Abditibacteriaceae bacterium]
MIDRLLAGTPGKVAMRQGKRKIARSTHKARGQRVARLENKRRHRGQVKQNYHKKLLAYRAEQEKKSRPVVVAAPEPVKPPVLIASTPPKSAPPKTAPPKTTASAKPDSKTPPKGNGATPKPGSNGGKTPSNNTKPNRNTGPLVAEGPAPPVPVASAPVASVPSAPAPEPDVIIETPRQNLTLSFVNPHQQPVAALQLVARVQTPEGEKTFPDLKTDDKGCVQLAGLELPATIALDFAVPGGEKSSETKASDAAGEAAEIQNQDELQGELQNVPEWDFVNGEAATLLVETPVGEGKLAWRRGDDSPRFASLRLPQMGPKPRVAREIIRTMIYSGQAEPIVVERNLIDLEVVAPAGSKLSTPALENQTLEVPESGRLALRLLRAQLAEGPVPIRLARQLEGGESEAVISHYTMDPYQTNTVEAPGLQLVRLTETNVTGRLGVMGTNADVVRVLGNLKAKTNSKNQLGKVTPMPDGSEWWVYNNAGLGFKMRPTLGANIKDKNAVWLVERVRLFHEKGGSLGRIRVGSNLDEVGLHWGVPQAENEAKLPSDVLSAAGQIDSWLDGSLRACHAAGKVLWIETVRPDSLLISGSTAFVPREQARVWVEGFVGHPRLALRNGEDFKRFLRQLNAVRVVDSKEEADLLIRAQVVNFHEDKDSLTKLLPFKYSCSFRLSYSLYDVAEQKYVVQDKIAEGAAKVSYATEAALVGIVGGVLIAKGKGMADVLGGLLLGGGIYELHKAMQKAVNRSPGIAARSAFHDLASDVSRASDFSARVSRIDYSANRLWLNVGSEAGLKIGDQFEVAVGGVALPYQEWESDANYYVVKVIEVHRDRAVCDLRHMRREVSKFKEKFFDVDDEHAKAMLKRLPEPATGLVSARALVNFPEVNIISDADVQASLDEFKRKAEEQAAQQAEQAQQNQNNQQNQTKPAKEKKSNPLGDLLGGLLGK